MPLEVLLNRRPQSTGALAVDHCDGADMAQHTAVQEAVHFHDGLIGGHAADIHLSAAAAGSGASPSPAAGSGITLEGYLLVVHCHLAVAAVHQTEIRCRRLGLDDAGLDHHIAVLILVGEDGTLLVELGNDDNIAPFEGTVVVLLLLLPSGDRIGAVIQLADARTIALTHLGSLF